MTIAEPENAMTALSSAVAKVVDLLVAEDYDGVEALTSGRRLSADELRTAVAGQGCTLAPLLSLELRLVEAEAGGYDVEVVDLRVL